MIADIINGSFEAGAGVAALAHCLKLYEDKAVRGVNMGSVVFYIVWGIWNVFYYPHLEQFWSCAGGVFVTLTNVIYLAMLWRYRPRINGQIPPKPMPDTHPVTPTNIVFIGTTGSMDYLKPELGNRRCWPFRDPLVKDDVQ